MSIYYVDKEKLIEDLAKDSVYAYNTKYPHNTYSNLEEMKLEISNHCIARVKNENGEEKYQNYFNSLNKMFETKMKNFSDFDFDDDYEELSKSDITFFTLDEKETDKLAKEITSILDKNQDMLQEKRDELQGLSILKRVTKKMEIEKIEISLVKETIEKTFDNTIPVEFNDNLQEKTDEFSKSIKNVHAIASLFDFDENKEKNTEFYGTLVQKDEKKEYTLEFYDNYKNYKGFKTNSLLELRDELVDFIKEKKSDNKELMNSLKGFECVKITEPNIETEKNFRFQFDKVDNFYGGTENKFSLKIENEKAFEKTTIINNDFDKLAFALVDKDTSKLFKVINKFEIETTYKDEYLIEQTKHLVEKLDNFVKNESLEKLESGIFNKVIRETNPIFIENGSDLDISDFKKILNDKFNETFASRVESLKDKEEFLIKNAEHFNLTVENNKIVELNEFYEENYKENIDSFITGYKENVYLKFNEELDEKMSEFLMTKKHYIDTNDEKEAYVVGLANMQNLHQYNYFYEFEEKLINNFLILAFDEEDIENRYYDKEQLLMSAEKDRLELSETIVFNSDKVEKTLKRLPIDDYEKFSQSKIKFDDKIEVKEKTDEKELTTDDLELQI